MGGVTESAEDGSPFPRGEVELPWATFLYVGGNDSFNLLAERLNGDCQEMSARPVSWARCSQALRLFSGEGRREGGEEDGDRHGCHLRPAPSKASAAPWA